MRTASDDYELLDELVEAHLDTIEIALANGLVGEWEHHVTYLRSLVRVARRASASPLESSRPSRSQPLA